MNKSYVFLYHNGYGIIAAGKGTATIKDGYNDILDEEERSIKLSHFICGVNTADGNILKFLSPAYIKQLLQRDFYFPNSIVTLSENEASTLFEECKNEFK